MSGNNVSHANRKVRRRFLPNLQQASLMSEALGRPLRLRLSARALRSIDKRGGLDAFLLAARESELEPSARRLRRAIKARLAARASSN